MFSVFKKNKLIEKNDELRKIIAFYVPRIGIRSTPYKHFAQGKKVKRVLGNLM